MPEFDPRSYAYPSRRNVVYARKTMACTSIPQGAQIGLDVMKAGGNAMDAAVAMAAAMPLLFCQILPLFMEYRLEILAKIG